MADIIVVLIVIVLLGFALRGAIRHFKGDSPCCGGGTGIIKTDDKELKNPVIGKKIVHIEGMTCEHCVQSVKKALNEIEGVSARVDLQKKEAVVSYDREIENDVLKMRNKYSSQKGNYTSQVFFEDDFSVKTYYIDEKKVKEVYYSGESVLRVKNYDKQ